jgi:Zn-finger nucleic acid-binding protein
MDTMECPKCQGSMRTYERNGIHVDQCTECRGVFLDRGELEHLIALEAAQSAPAAPEPAPAAAPQQPQQQPQHQPQGYQQPYPQQQYPQQGYNQGYGGKPYKKKKSFLEELFD